MDELLALAAARAITYLRGNESAPVFPSPEAIEALSGFVEALPTHKTSPADLLDQLDRLGSPATVRSSGGRYLGYVTGGAYPVAVGASWLSAAWDQNAAVGNMSPVAGVLDTVVGRWLIELLGLGAGAQHQFVAGTSAANVACLAMGRDALLAERGWDCAANGLFGAPEIRVVVSEGAHSSIEKALGVVGLGRSRIVSVPADDQGRLVASKLPEPGPATLVIAQAGNVNTGAMDPFDEIADHFAGSMHWLHVDGAFGLWAATSPATRDLVAGVERAHSWATDMHKWLNTTYDAAVAIVHDPEAMLRTFHVGAPYIADTARIEPLSRGIEMSQRARAIEVWAVLKSLGTSGVAEHTERLCGHAKRLAAALRDGGIEVVNDVELNQVLIRLGDDTQTSVLLERIQRSETLWAGPTQWDDRPAIRLSVCSWATTDSDIDRIAAEITGLSTTA